MAAAVEKHWDEHHTYSPLAGIVVTRYGHGFPDLSWEKPRCRRTDVIEAAHPVPDAHGQSAARLILAAVQNLNENDLVLCLISGGGSALLAVPGNGISLEDKQEINRALLRSGADISEMNAVRKHLSAIKGGRLAIAAAPAPVLTLAISDVPGDDPSVIASGPTVADPTTREDALAVLDRYGINSPRIANILRNAQETPKPGDPRLANATLKIIANAQGSLEAAAEAAREAGVTPLILGDAIEGEAREVGRVLAGIARQVVQYGQPVAPPVVLLSGGETTVTVRGNGRGGRNAELLLGFALAADGLPGVYALACDTDGIDGSEDNAGAVVTPDTLTRAENIGENAVQRLEDNDAYTFFKNIDDLIVTGPTRTNVNDFRAVLIMPAANI